MGAWSHPRVTPKGVAESLGALVGKGQEEGMKRREGQGSVQVGVVHLCPSSWAMLVP